MKTNLKELCKLVEMYNCRQIGDRTSTRGEVDAQLLFDFLEMSHFNKDLLKKLYKDENF